MHTHVRACMCMCMCVHVLYTCLEVNIEGLLFLSRLFCEMGFSLFCLDWLASVLGLQPHGTMPKFYVGAKDSDSVLHAS